MPAQRSHRRVGGDKDTATFRRAGRNKDAAASRRAGRNKDTAASRRAGRSRERQGTQTSTTDKRSVRARSQRLARRDQILRAAEKVFAKKGFHTASITNVIEAAGVSRGTFYLYFDSKRAIFGELLDDLFRKLAACVRHVDLAPGAPSPLEQLRANVSCALQVVAENQDLTGILFRTGQGIDAEADLKVENFTSGVVGLIRRALHRGKEIGVVRPLDEDLVSLCIYGSLKEFVLNGLQSGRFNGEPLDPMVDEILRYNMRGFLNA